MGKSRAKEMNFWTKEEFLQFAKVMENYPKSYYAFQILFWCGIRVGELLALILDDIDFDKRTLSITKLYQRIVDTSKLSFNDLLMLHIAGEGLAMKYCNNAEGVLTKRIENKAPNIGADYQDW